jgi:hypothetical protein
MRVLILQQPTSTSPVDHWLKEAIPDAEISIVSAVGTARPDEGLSPGVTRYLYGAYSSEAAMAGLIALCERWRPDRIVSNSEDDILRAGHLRSLFGISGQKSAMALRFRDKVKMKLLFEEAGLTPVPSRSIQSADDVFEALADFGEIVVKPRLGAGSMGVHFLASEAEARQLLAGDPELVEALLEDRLMAEVRQSGSVYHIDIALKAGRPLLISPSIYLDPPHTFARKNVASVMLDMGSTPYESLRALATKFVSALPQDHGASLLHLEVYADGEGGYLAGEVACRLGGGLIKDSIRHTYGVDLSRLGYLLATGIDNEAEPRERVSGQTGFLLWTATEPPPEADEKPAWCIKSFYCARTVDAVDSVDALGRFLVEGSCAEQIEARIRSLEGMGPTAGRQFS